MVSKWNTSGFDAPVDTWVGSDYLARLLDGVNTALTHFSGSSDPSTGAPVTWGSAEVGMLWLDTTDASNPRLKRWQLLDSPSTYGWRTLRFLKTKWLTAPKALTLAGSPAAADLAYADYVFSTDLDDSGSGDVQDAGGQESAKVTGVWLRVVVVADAAETLGADDGYMKWRQKGSTVEQRVYAAVAGRTAEATIFVPLDTAETAEWGIVVGGAGSPAFVFSASIVGLVEEC